MLEQAVDVAMRAVMSRRSFVLVGFRPTDELTVAFFAMSYARWLAVPCSRTVWS